MLASFLVQKYMSIATFILMLKKNRAETTHPVLATSDQASTSLREQGVKADIILVGSFSEGVGRKQPVYTELNNLLGFEPVIRFQDLPYVHKFQVLVNIEMSNDISENVPFFVKWQVSRNMDVKSDRLWVFGKIHVKMTRLE